MSLIITLSCDQLRRYLFHPPSHPQGDPGVHGEGGTEGKDGTPVSCNNNFVLKIVFYLFIYVDVL